MYGLVYDLKRYFLPIMVVATAYNLLVSNCQIKSQLRRLTQNRCARALFSLVFPVSLALTIATTDVFNNGRRKMVFKWEKKPNFFFHANVDTFRLNLKLKASEEVINHRM